MHPVLVNLLRHAADVIDGEDPERVIRNLKTSHRRFKKVVNSRKFQNKLGEIASQTRSEVGRAVTRAVARKLRSLR